MRANKPANVHSPRWLAVVAALCVGGIALGSFALSFTALSDLAARSGIPESIAWVWPTIIDGSIVTAMLVIFQWRNAPRREVAWPWVTLSLFALVSIVGNAVHTVTVVDATGGVAVPFAVFVGSMPPIALLLSSEMLVRLLARGNRAPQMSGQVAADTPHVVAPVVTGDMPALSTPKLPVSSPAIAVDTAVTPQSERVGNDTRVALDCDTAVTGGDTFDSPAPEGDTSPVEPVSAVATAQPWTPEVIAGQGVPEGADAQVDWLVKRLAAGEEFSRDELAELFDVSARTAARRLAAARKVVPEVTAESAAEEVVKEG